MNQASRRAKRVKSRVKSHSDKRKSSRATARPPEKTKPRIPPAIEVAIDEQCDSLGIAISLLYCLHAALRPVTAYRVESDPKFVGDAPEWANLIDVSAMLLVRLTGIRSALDSWELQNAHVDPEQLELAEAAARKLQKIGSDKREAS